MDDRGPAVSLIVFLVPFACLGAMAILFTVAIVVAVRNDQPDDNSVRAAVPHRSITPENAAAIVRWAREDGHRTAGIGHAQVCASTRPHGGLCEVIPMDELRRRRQVEPGGAA